MGNALKRIIIKNVLILSVWILLLSGHELYSQNSFTDSLFLHIPLKENPRNTFYGLLEDIRVNDLRIDSEMVVVGVNEFQVMDKLQCRFNVDVPIPNRAASITYTKYGTFNLQVDNTPQEECLPWVSSLTFNYRRRWQAIKDYEFIQSFLIGKLLPQKVTQILSRQSPNGTGESSDGGVELLLSTNYCPFVGIELYKHSKSVRISYY